MRQSRFLNSVALAVAAGLYLAGCAQPAAGPTADLPAAQLADSILTVDQLRPGMTGYGLTVFEGARPQRFNVQIISVLRNYDPQTDMILIRCSGHNLEKTGIAAGMSGSPIYINGKLIGALAFGWSFTVEPIAGVQPIAQMLRNSGMHGALPPAEQEIPDRSGQAAEASNSGLRIAGLSRAPRRDCGFNDGGRGSFSIQNPKSSIPNASSDRPLSHNAADDSKSSTRLRPLSTPLMVSGGSPAVMRLLREQLAGSGFVPLASGGAAGDPRMDQARIEPGGTVAIPLLTGDMDIAAIGTVTAVVGNRVLAFGHPMFGEGPVNLPMGVGVIHTFIPSLESSFKLGSAGPVVGAVRRDESHSIMGLVGPDQKPAMTPMTVKVTAWDGSPTKTYHYQVVDEWYFAARMATVAALYSATADHGEPIELTVHYRGTVKFKGLPPYTFDDISGYWGLYDVADRLYYPIRTMLNSPYGKALVESIELEMRLVNERETMSLERARLEHAVLAPGEPAVVQLTFDRYRKPKLNSTLTLDLPADLPDGQYELMLLDSEDYRGAIQQMNPRLFDPQTLAETLAVFRKLAEPRADRYYWVLPLPDGGLATHSQRMPDLPASRAMILRQADREPIYGFRDHRVWPVKMDGPVYGSARFAVTIDRDKGRHP